MDILIWVGATISASGLFGILWCAFQVIKAKRANLSDEALRGRIQRVMPINLAALFLSVIGLMLVVVGILLG